MTAVLFDLDGTLTDPFEGISRCFQYALDRLEVEANGFDFRTLIGPPMQEAFQALATLAVVPVVRVHVVTGGLRERDPAAFRHKPLLSRGLRQRARRPLRA